MANEIRTNARFQVINGDYSDSLNFSNKLYDQAAIGAHKPIIIVGTSEEVLSLGDIVTPGACIFHNLDTTNYVDIGPTSGGALVPMIRLKPDQYAILWLTPTVVLRAQANTANVKLLMMALEA